MAFIGLDFTFSLDHPDAEFFWEQSLDGFHDEEIGESESSPGWFCVFYEQGAILRQDSQGFIHMADFSTPAETAEAWGRVEQLFESYELS